MNTYIIAMEYNPKVRNKSCNHVLTCLRAQFNKEIADPQVQLC